MNPPFYDEKTGYILPFVDSLKVENQQGGSCGFYATFIGVVQAYFLSRGLKPPTRNPYADWKEFYTKRNMYKDGELYTSISFEEACGYYKEKGLIPYHGMIYINGSSQAIMNIMKRDRFGVLLTVRTYDSYSQDFSYNPTSKLHSANHQVWGYGGDKDFCYVFDSRGIKAHRFYQDKFIDSGGKYRIPWGYFDGKHVLAQKFPVIFNKQWSDYSKRDKKHMALVLTGKVDNLDITSDNEEASRFQKEIASDPATKNIWDTYLKEQGVIK